MNPRPARSGLALPLFVLSAISLLTACDSAAGDEGQNLDMVIAVGDTLRDVRLRIPAGLSPGDPARLLVALHGSSDNGRNFQRGARVDDEVPEDLIVAYPTAAEGNWAEGCGCNIADRLQIDDLGFMEALIDTVSVTYRITRDETWAMGFSQGGLFAYRLACEMGDRFAGVAAISAPMSEPLSRSCRANTPVSVMTFHGKKDAVLPWDGTDAGALSLLSAPETGLFWADKYGCDPSVKLTHREDGATVVESRWAECAEDAQVRLYELPAGEHAWYTSSPDVRGYFLDFFLEAGH